MELRDKNVLVVGFERNGRSRLPVPPRPRGPRPGHRQEAGGGLRGHGPAPGRAGRRLRDWAATGPGSFLEADLIVPSPGVPPLAEIRAARDKGVPVVSEIELAFLFLRGRIVGITGTNGKSTTATLVHRILKEAGLKARLAGNIGTPLVSFVDRSRDDHVYVTEISSFQLEYTERFTPAVAVLLNVSENHLDWHGTFEDYFGAKKKLVLRQGPGGAAVLNRDDRLVWGLAAEAAVRRPRLQPEAPPRPRRLPRGRLDRRPRRPDGADRAGLASLPLPGAHNLENVLAAALVGRLLGVPAPSLRRSILAFRGLEHRLEDVLPRRAASASSTIPRRRPSPRRSRPWPASTAPSSSSSAGAAKAATSPLSARRSRRRSGRSSWSAKRPTRSRPRSAASCPSTGSRDYREVVRTAFARAGRGDVVLLAPACTSWDMFRDFEERGRTFKREVRRLAAGLRKKGASR